MGKFFEVINRVLIANEGWKVILSGLGKTVEIALFAIVIGTVLGCLFALMKISTIKPLRWFANLYTTIIRGIPMEIGRAHV